MAFENSNIQILKSFKLKSYCYDPKRFEVKKIINYQFVALFELYNIYIEVVFTTFVWEKNVMFFFVASVLKGR